MCVTLLSFFLSHQIGDESEEGVTSEGGSYIFFSPLTFHPAMFPAAFDPHRLSDSHSSFSFFFFFLLRVRQVPRGESQSCRDGAQFTVAP